jgi:hypothetical protein
MVRSAVTFSEGVEFIYGNETQKFGDIGVLAAEIRDRAAFCPGSKRRSKASAPLSSIIAVTTS